MTAKWTEIMWTQHEDTLDARYNDLVCKPPTTIDLYVYNADKLYQLAHTAMPRVKIIPKAFLDNMAPIDKKIHILYCNGISMYGKYNRAQNVLVDTPSHNIPESLGEKKDFCIELRKLVIEVKEGGNILVFDYNDMTLLQLLYICIERPDLNIYYTYDETLRKTIHVNKVLFMLQHEINDYSTKGARSLLFILPLVLLTGIPNLGSHQLHMNSGKLFEMIEKYNEARGNIMEEDSINTGVFLRFMKQLAERELDTISSFIPILHKNKESNPYDPKPISTTEYRKKYYDTVTSVGELVKGFLSAMLELNHYFEGSDYIEHYFIDAPICSDMYEYAMTLNQKYKIEHVSRSKIQYVSKSFEIRSMNRLPILRGVPLM